MDKPTLYLETSVISYLAALPSRDPVTARNQQITREWWDTRRGEYELRTSLMVITEAEAGDPIYARRRRALLDGVAVLAAGEDVDRLAVDLLASVPLPPKALADATHIALSALRGLEYLLTWNCKHIANPRLQARIQQVLRAAGVAKPVLCTPVDLMVTREFRVGNEEAK
jgi:hypothetical protein